MTTRMHIIKLFHQPTGCIIVREGLPAFSFLADVMMSLPFKRKGIIEVEVPYIFLLRFHDVPNEAWIGYWVELPLLILRDRCLFCAGYYEERTDQKLI